MLTARDGVQRRRRLAAHVPESETQRERSHDTFSEEITRKGEFDLPQLVRHQRRELQNLLVTGS